MNGLSQKNPARGQMNDISNLDVRRRRRLKNMVFEKYGF
jgi:hypothetical protein